MQVDGVHEAWVSLRQVVAAVDASVDAALYEIGNLSADAFIALKWLQRRAADSEPVAPGGLEQELNLTSSGMSRLLGRLESSGWIVRSPSPTDRRAIVVSLTPAATGILQRAQPYATDAVRRVLEQPGPSTDIDQLDAVVRSAADAGGSAAEQDLSISGVLTWHTVNAVSAADAHVVRQALEPQIFVEAARYATETAAADLMTIVVDMMRNIDDPQAFFAADTRFHMRLAELCQNRALREVYMHMLDRLQHMLKSVDGDAEATGPYLAQRARVHADLVDAVRRHDVEAVEVTARSHRLVRIAGGPAADRAAAQGSTDSGVVDPPTGDQT